MEDGRCGVVGKFLLTDQVGSLRAVADTSGNIAKRIDYDSFGNIIADTNPSFSVPFGFAGGLHDRDTGLVRFGYRDYSPELGRFVAKDPINFAGGDTNLYAYAMSDPINFIDPFGLRVSLYDKISTIVQLADLLPINSIPTPVTIGIGVVLDVSAATFALIDISRACHLSAAEEKRALATWLTSLLVSGISYVPNTVGAVFGTAAEATLFEIQVHNLTGQWNPFYGWRE